MEMKHQEVYVMQLVRYFIEQQDYQMVIVQNSKNDIWLANVDQPQYPIIRLCAESEGQQFFDRDYIKEVYESICEQLQIAKPLLMIQTSPLAETIQWEQAEVVSILPNAQVPSKIAQVFHGIEQVVHSVNNADQEIKTIGKRIRDVQLERQKQLLRSLRQPPRAFWIIMALSLLLFALTTYVSLSGSDIYQGVLLGGAYYKPSMMAAYEYWRFFTAPFAHYSLFQLLIDLYVLYLLAKSVDTFYPHKLFLIFMIASLCGYGVSYIGVDNELAFGMVPGLLGIWGAYSVAIFAKKMMRIPPIKSAYIRSVLVIAILLLAPGISYLGVLAGFTAGVLCGIVLSDEAICKQLRPHVLIAAAILAGGLCWYQVNRNQMISNRSETLDSKLIEAYENIGLHDYAKWVEGQINTFYEEGK